MDVGELTPSTDTSPRPASSFARPRSTALAALVVSVWLGDFTQSLGQFPLDDPFEAGSLPEVNPDGWTSSAVCGQCHQAIHAVWQQSLHAKSWSNGVFQAGYRRAVESHGPEQARLCLSCHAPTVRHGGDFAVKEGITAEGVTCDFCHSISAVELSDPRDPIRFAAGGAKYGPLRHAQSPAHKIVNSELHTRSEFCAGCHEYRNKNGLTILGTYSEWKGSTYAKRGKQCQDCHMPMVPGRVVALSVKSKTPTSVNLHNISGSHDIERVRKAVRLDLVGYDWISDRVWVYVKVTNEGSGHCFPTGLPMHRAVLEVAIRDGAAEVGRRELPFEIVMLDAEGRPLRREHEVFFNATRIRSDTRLRPNEARMLEVSFRDITASKLTVTAALYYEYSTETVVVDGEGSRIEPAHMKFLIASRQDTIKLLGR